MMALVQNATKENLMSILDEIAQAAAKADGQYVLRTEQQLLDDGGDEQLLRILRLDNYSPETGLYRVLVKAKDFLELYPEFYYSNPDEWRTGEKIAEGYETWVKFYILSHYGAHGDESYVERGNARWLVEEFLPQYPEKDWEVSGGGMYTTYVAIDTQSECWEDLFEYLASYHSYPSLGKADDQLWYEEEHNELIGDCWQWLQDLDLPEGYEWVEDKEFGYCNYAEIPSLFGAMRVDEEQEDFGVVEEILYEFETNSNCLETSFQYRPSSLQQKAVDAVLAKLVEVGRVRPVAQEETDECETCGQQHAALDDYGNCATCQFFGGLSD
jgi:hypothetical protein